MLSASKPTGSAPISTISGQVSIAASLLKNISNPHPQNNLFVISTLCGLQGQGLHAKSCGTPIPDLEMIDRVYRALLDLELTNKPNFHHECLSFYF